MSRALYIIRQHPKDFHEDPETRAAFAFLAEHMVDTHYIAEVMRALTRDNG